MISLTKITRMMPLRAGRADAALRADARLWLP
jgi:hypothetical protein